MLLGGGCVSLWVCLLDGFWTYAGGSLSPRWTSQTYLVDLSLSPAAPDWMLWMDLGPD